MLSLPIYEYQCGKCGKIKELFTQTYGFLTIDCEYCRGTMHKQITKSFSFSVQGGTPIYGFKPEGLEELDANIDELELRKAQKKKEKEQKELDKLTKKYFV